MRLRRIDLAKKTAVMRVHQLAKELGVSSKDVVAKCQAEDIPDITNHMSAISVGLSVTVREWFGGGSGASTAVETAAPVDLSKVRKKKPRKKASKASATAVAEKAVTTEVEAAVVTPSEVVEPPVEGAAEVPEVAPAVAAEAPSSTAPEKSGDSDGGDTTPTSDDPNAPIMNVPSRPDVVKPAGTQLTEKKKVNLSGPVVVRVEQPDVMPEPRPQRQERRPEMPQRSVPRTGGGVRGMEYQTELPPNQGGRGVGNKDKDRDRGKRNDRRRGGEGAGRSSRTFQGQGNQGSNQGGRNTWRDQDLLERDRRLNAAGGFFKRHRQDRSRRRGPKQVVQQRPEGPVKVVEPISIKELSAATGIKANDILKQLFMMGVMTNINSSVETDQAIEVMASYDIELEVVEFKTAAEQIEQQFETRDREDERPRAPIVTILGHVDHGKTSLLDRIRQANVAEGEAGGITQATSAFRVPVKAGDGDRVVTFIDTPGHEAFTEMRARGAKVTDIVVLVVAADDGVMPQTVESINHSKAAGVPIVVALNKIDRPDATEANIQRILGQLAEHELNPVEWGGSTEVVKTSAIQGDGIQDLLDTLDFQAELLELKADFEGNAEGTVLESQVEEGRGSVARILVQEGQLHKGDFIVAGRAFGRVRDIVDDHGKRISDAGPSTPIAISGIDEVPNAGDKFYVVDSLKAAESAAEEAKMAEREKDLAQPKVTLDNIFDRMKDSGAKELPLVVKGDVQGSVETLRAVLGKIGSDEVRVSIKHSAVGGISESDVMLAQASGAIVIGFNVTSTPKARAVAEQRGVDIRLYDVIYDITDDVTKAAAGLLAPELKLEVLGHADVRDVFRVSKVGMVAGCYITDGFVERNSQIRVTRDGIVIENDRRLEQLKRFKDDVKEVKSGMECGMKIDGYDDIKAGDVLECYKTIEVARTL
jgi:translation initiation factor IF-2